MTARHSPFDAAIQAVIAANSAVWHAIAGFRYMREARDAGVPFELIIDGDYIATEPFPGLGVNWTFKVYPNSCASVRRTWFDIPRVKQSSKSLMPCGSMRWHQTSSGAMKVSPPLSCCAPCATHMPIVGMTGLSNAKLPLRWRQLDLVPGMQGLTVSETIFLNEQLLLINDAIYLIDPDSALTTQVHR